jgi:hypothetical protein
MAFEEFTAKKRSNSKIPMVSILKWGRISLNSECYTNYLKDCKLVILLYDAQHKKMGIRPTNQNLSHAFNLKADKKGKLANISAASFLEHYGIPYTESRSFACHWNETEKILEVQL